MTPQSLPTLHPLGPELPAWLGDFYDEPAWMREARAAAWAQYEALPYPQRKEEAWRRAPIERFPLETLRIQLSRPAALAYADLPPFWLRHLNDEADVAGTLVQADGGIVYRALRPDLAAQGMVLDDLHQVLHTHGSLIQSYWNLGEWTRPSFDRFSALNAALWQDGVLLYVPAGVRVSLPIQVLTVHTAASASSFPRVLLIAEAGSQVTLIYERLSQERTPEINNEIVELHVGEGARVRYVSLQHWGEQRWSVSHQNACLGRDALLQWSSFSFGSAVTKDFLRTDLLAPEAQAVLHGVTCVTGHQVIDQSTYQHHRAPETQSNLLFRNVVLDEAQAIFYGMIRVEPEAQQTRGYQACNALLLGKGRAHAIPGLEIWANDVQCSHGATVARVDEEQLFYLQARAISRAVAQRLIVNGFVEPLIAPVPQQKTRDRLREDLALRLG